jgi:hypothetical protein
MDAWYVVERGRFSFTIHTDCVPVWGYLVGQYGLVSSFTTTQEKNTYIALKNILCAKCSTAALTLAKIKARGISAQS